MNDTFIKSTCQILSVKDDQEILQSMVSKKTWKTEIQTECNSRTDLV